MRQSVYISIVQTMNEVKEDNFQSRSQVLMILPSRTWNT